MLRLLLSQRSRIKPASLVLSRASAREISGLCGGSNLADVLVPIVFRSCTCVPFKIPAEKERVAVSDLLGNLFDGVAALEEAPARVVNSFPSQPVNRS
jgi:hypothetical protein